MPPKPTAPGRVTKAKGKNLKDASLPTIRRSLRSSTKYTSTTTTTTPTQESSASATTMPDTPVPTTSSSPPPPSTDLNPVYFWRPADGNGYLGQWYWSSFTVDDETYATAEMWMMVQKARLFNDEVAAKKMLATTDPKKHKALGRTVRGFDGGVWDEHKLAIVTQGNYHKFTVSDDAANLKGMLLATGERELVEASPLDRIWGVGFAEKNAGSNRHRWGENLLGKALMNVRERLRKEEEKK